VEKGEQMEGGGEGEGGVRERGGWGLAAWVQGGIDASAGYSQLQSGHPRGKLGQGNCGLPVM